MMSCKINAKNLSVSSKRETSHSQNILVPFIHFANGVLYSISGTLGIEDIER